MILNKERFNEAKVKMGNAMATRFSYDAPNGNYDIVIGPTVAVFAFNGQLVPPKKMHRQIIKHFFGPIGGVK